MIYEDKDYLWRDECSSWGYMDIGLNNFSGNIEFLIQVVGVLGLIFGLVKCLYYIILGVCGNMYFYIFCKSQVKQ